MKKRPAVSLESYTRDTGLDPDDPSEYVKPSAAIERTEDERQLHDAIARLSPEHRDVLVLKDLDGMKYEEIAEVLGVPIGTIRSRLHRARLELRDLLVPLDEQREEREGRGTEPDEPELPNETENLTPPPTQPRRVRRGD